MPSNWLGLSNRLLVSQHPDDADGGSRAVRSAGITDRDYLLDAVIGNELVNLRIQFLEFVHRVEDFEFGDEIGRASCRERV